MGKKIIKNDNEISELLNVTLGGYGQKILIEGKSKELPVVLTLHGGPGTPIPFSVGCRGLFPEFTDKFIMVYWDQFGCGINNHIITDHFSIDSFVQMTEELVIELKKMFPDNKFLIFSTSWGSILSAMLLDKNPYAADVVVACGQIIKNVCFCDEVIKTLADSRIPGKKLEHIKTVTPENYTGKDLQLIFSSLKKYTNAYENKDGEKAPMGKMIKGLLSSPDYKFKDFTAVVVNGYRKNNSLWKEILKLDLSDQLANVKVPYIILQGDTDIVASTSTVTKLVAECANPNLNCMVVKNTGHFPGVEMMDKLLNVLEEYSR
ncbi:MAG: alpha/beta fold hydrolase [Muribaculaceae bacterium]|nr:alpha/beta fold hydrolase [Roseburia sp.]MCM1431331.1 alpha/beta fold hydrolase [Muribaculaceae bacterium]MCM1491773.1 alpha/beta fold hydrolase [Muribaculaceae bacterium]